VKIEGKYVTPLPRERVFPFLIDENVARRCIPGCRQLIRESEDRFAVVLDLGLGSIQGTYQGTVSFSQKISPERLEMIVDGKGKLGFVSGKASLQLAEDEPQTTLITYQGDVQIGGTIAGIGQRMLQGTAKMMAGQFFAAIEAEAKAAESELATVKHGRLRNFFRWLTSILRGVFKLSYVKHGMRD
jgi:carbon monoxide dehydrogenase subunit G